MQLKLLGACITIADSAEYFSIGVNEADIIALIYPHSISSTKQRQHLNSDSSPSCSSPLLICKPQFYQGSLANNHLITILTVVYAHTLLDDHLGSHGTVFIVLLEYSHSSCCGCLSIFEAPI